MADLSLRRYLPADADAVWDLHERALRDAGGYDETFAHRDGVLVTMGAFQPHADDPDEMVVRRMRVDPVTSAGAMAPVS
ncbi:MAG: hypothetical protein ABEH86_03440 [Haloarcula sp.]